jgi:hypothetical protein
VIALARLPRTAPQQHDQYRVTRQPTENHPQEKIDE